MKHSPYGEANSSLNIQEILFVLFNLKVCIHTSNGPPLALILSQMNKVTSSQPVSIKFILILFLHQHLGLQSVCFHEVFHTKTLCALLFWPMCATLHAHRSFCGDVYKQKNFAELWLDIANRSLWLRVRGLVLRLHMNSVVLWSTRSSDIAPILINIVTF